MIALERRPFSARQSAGTAARWCCDDDKAGVVEVAWFNKIAGWMTHPVGEIMPNARGLYDMSGKVWQFCADWNSKDYYAQFRHAQHGWSQR